MKEVSTEKVDANNHSSAASVEEDRKNSIDASIVRIMKARKRSSHHDLIAEVTKQLSGRFNPLPQVIFRQEIIISAYIHLNYSGDQESHRKFD